MPAADIDRRAGLGEPVLPVGCVAVDPEPMIKTESRPDEAVPAPMGPRMLLRGRGRRRAWIAQVQPVTFSEEVTPAGSLIVASATRATGAVIDRGSGCCGLGGHGPNQLCAGCGSVLGVAWTACVTQDEVRFFPTAVDLVT